MEESVVLGDTGSCWPNRVAVENVIHRTEGVLLQAHAPHIPHRAIPHSAFMRGVSITRYNRNNMQTTMPKHSSAAARLHELLEKGSSLPGNTAVLKAWAVLFDIPEPYDVGLSVDVAERLVGLNQDLKRLWNSGDAGDRPEPVLKHIEQALSPVYLGSNWEVVKQFLSSDTLATFKQWAEKLPDAEAH
jgi:hypothetical protein